jgi:probable HAF family extracellular repeat protein
MVFPWSIAWRWVATLAIIAGGPAVARAGFTITDLGVIVPTGTSAATGINANGQASGMVTVAGGGMVAASSSPGGTLQPVAVPSGASSSFATSINGAGAVAGNFSSPTVTQEAFHSSAGGAVPLGFLAVNGVSGSYSQANGINDGGQVVGTGGLPSGVNRAFISTSGTLTMIAPLGSSNPGTSALSNWANGINNAGTVVGTSEIVPGGLQQAFFTAPSGSPVSLATRNSGGNFQSSTAGMAIANNGDIVGYGVVGSSEHAFYAPDAGGPLVDLGTLANASSSMALAVNNNGLVVGTSGGRAFLWGASAGINDLNLLISPANQANWVLTEATGINDAGQISGEGDFDGVLHGFVLTPSAVPTPPALVLSASGLAIVWGWSRLKLKLGRSGRRRGV